MMLKVWHWYQNCLSVHPVKTQVISSGTLWAVGDITAQYVTHSAAKKRLQLSLSVRITIFITQYPLSSCANSPSIPYYITLFHSYEFPASFFSLNFLLNEAMPSHSRIVVMVLHILKFC